MKRRTARQTLDRVCTLLEESVELQRASGHELPLLLTPTQAGRELGGISDDAVYALVHDVENPLPAIRIGARQRIRVRRADLEKWVNTQETLQQHGARLMRGGPSLVPGGRRKDRENPS